MNDENWVEQYKKWKPGLKSFQIQLLEEGAQSHSQAWLLNSMWCDWKELKKLKDTDLPALEAQTSSLVIRDPWEELEPYG